MKKNRTVWAPCARKRLELSELAGGPYYVLEPLAGSPGELRAREVVVFAAPPQGGQGKRSRTSRATKPTETE